jgi:hypothetical protein
MIRAAGRVAALVVPLCVSGWSPDVFAYRPFVGTDAAVAAPGEMEIEIGPSYLREGSTCSVTAPAVVANLGLAERWEAVFEGEAEHGLSADNRRSSLVGAGAFLKGTLREGVLQDKSGPSIATEFGLLLPGINDEPGTGASLAAIVSQRWTWGTVHLNVAGALTRQHHGDLFVGAIVEGPYDWTVRPVAEVFRERDFGGLTTTSGLIGAIWQVRDNLSVDFGLRKARANDQAVNEVRAGLTFSFPLR